MLEEDRITHGAAKGLYERAERAFANAQVEPDRDPQDATRRRVYRQNGIVGTFTGRAEQGIVTVELPDRRFTVETVLRRTQGGVSDNDGYASLVIFPNTIYHGVGASHEIGFIITHDLRYGLKR